MANSLAFWSKKAVVSREYNKLESHTAKLNAVKDQIRIRVIGFSWIDLHHPWLKDGKVYTAEELFKYLVDILVPEQAVRGIPEVPTMDCHLVKYLLDLDKGPWMLKCLMKGTKKRDNVLLMKQLQ